MKTTEIIRYYKMLTPCTWADCTGNNNREAKMIWEYGNNDSWIYTSTRELQLGQRMTTYDMTSSMLSIHNGD